MLPKISPQSIARPSKLPSVPEAVESLLRHNSLFGLFGRIFSLSPSNKATPFQPLITPPCPRAKSCRYRSPNPISNSRFAVLWNCFELNASNPCSRHHFSKIHRHASLIFKEITTFFTAHLALQTRPEGLTEKKLPQVHETQLRTCDCQWHMTKAAFAGQNQPFGRKKFQRWFRPAPDRFNRFQFITALVNDSERKIALKRPKPPQIHQIVT